MIPAESKFCLLFFFNQLVQCQGCFKFNWMTSFYFRNSMWAIKQHLFFSEKDERNRLRYPISKYILQNFHKYCFMDAAAAAPSSISSILRRFYTVSLYNCV